MAQDQSKKLVSTTGIFVDIFITVLFWIYMTSVCADWAHAPAQTETMRWMVGAFAAIPVAGLCWFSLVSFRVTYVDEKRRKKEGKQ